VGTKGEGQPEFEAEFDRLFARAFAVARRLTGDAASAEDIAAEALTRTFVHWGRVRRFEHRDAWVARVATNLAIKSLRRAAPAPGAVVADPSDEAALRLALVDALGHLPRRQREAVALRYLADLSVDEVARTLGVSTGTVKQSVHRALRTLRDRMGPDLVIVTEEAT
jgi:RNA polymerase sigma-70 factor (sigma-E family)